MKKAFQLYFRYIPKWVYFYGNLEQIVCGLCVVYSGVIVPTTIAKFFTGTISFYRLLFVVGLITAVDVLLSVSTHIKCIFFEDKYDIRFRKGIQEELYTKMQYLSLRFYDDPTFFEKYRLASEHTVPAVKAMTNWVNNTVSLLISIFTSTLIVSLINAKILLMLLICLLLSGGFELIAALVALRSQKEMARLCNIFDYIKRVFYLKRYAIELRTSKISNVMGELFRNNLTQANQFMKKMLRSVYPFECMQICVTDVVVYFGVLGYACYSVIVLKNFTVSELVAVFTGAVALYRMLMRLINSFVVLFEQSEQLDYYTNFMALHDYDSGDGEAIKKPTREIKFCHVSFGYTEDKKVLHDISLTLPMGTRLAIVGPNGSGKSTFAKLLLRYYPVTEGEIAVDGKNINTFDAVAYRKLFTYMGQSTEILEMSIAENILMKKCETEADRDRVRCVLKEVGLWEKVCILPKSIDTVIGKEFTKEGIWLSGGEMQRLALARAIQRESHFLIIDEPSSHIDPIAEHDFFDLLQNINVDGVVIYITHSIQYAALADRIIWMEDGCILEEGTHESLMAQGGKYADTYCRLYNILHAD